MAYTLAFSVAQGTDASAFRLTDESTGSDVTATQRIVIVTRNDGTTIVPTGTTTTYINFPFSSGASIDIDVLPVDYAVSVTLEYLDVLGNVLYTLSQSYCFTENDEQFMYGLVQDISADDTLLSVNEFVLNCFRISMLVDYAYRAVVTGNDISGSQNLLDTAQYMIDHQTEYF